MNLEQLFCPNIDCPARGQANQGNLVIHSQIEKRCLCSVCNKSFAITKGTLFYRLRTDPKVVMCVIVLLAYGCPTQAIVQAFGFDERTVKNWWERAGHQCEAVHEHLIGQSQLDLQQVQADEIKAKILGGSLWLAMAIMVSTRLWLGGVASPHRDLELIQSLADRIRAMALCRPLLLAVDGLPGYPKAFQRAFRSKVPRSGKKGRPQLYAWPDIAIVQVIKRRLPAGLDKQPETLTAGLFIVGCFYNLCDPHHSLRLRLSVGRFGHRWVNRTPAMAAALTDHIWTVDELLKYRVPTARWKPPKQRGRRSKELLQVIERWC